MVLRRWGRKGRDDPAPASDPAAHRRRADDPPKRDGQDDPESQITAFTSAFDRPPTAEELRAAFSRRHTDEQPPPPPEDSFEQKFPTETLFVPTVDEPELEEIPHAEDRSCTTGDYYYDPEDAWAVLGLTPGAPWKEILVAHRRLAMRHHPDRLLDASPEQRAASEDTMREVNVAYNVLRRLTGN